MSGETIGLRERTRRAVRVELMGVAMELFLSQGFEATTVEQITATAGLSRRSFFRYFPSKDEVLAEALVSSAEAIATALAARPDGEDPWVSLRRAFDPLLVGIQGDERAMPMTRMMLESPSLQNSHHRKQTSWQEGIAAVLLTRLGASDEFAQLRADALASSALACLTVAQSRWVKAEGRESLSDLLDVAMNAVQH